MHGGNTVAAQYADVPAFATYHVHTNLHFFKYGQVLEKTVRVRTADQAAIVHDCRTDKDVVRVPFPAPWNTDLLGTLTNDGVFQLRSKGQIYRRGPSVSNVEPLKYGAAVKRDNFVVARAVKAYTPLPSSMMPANGSRI